MFMLFAPLEGWRHVEITDRHAALDYPQVLRDLSDRYFPGVSKIVLVQDNPEHPDATLEEQHAWLRQTFGVSVSMGTMWNTLRRLQVTQKTTFEASERGREEIAGGPAPVGLGCARGSMHGR